MLLEQERTELVDYCRRMQADDLTVGTSGNLSVRSGDLVAITPSGVSCSDSCNSVVPRTTLEIGSNAMLVASAGARTPAVSSANCR